MTSFRVDQAELSDIPELCELLGMLFALESDFSPDTEKQAAGLRHILAMPEWGRILVIREGAKVVGMITLLVVLSASAGGPVVVAEDLVVRPDYRSNGFGELLLKKAIEFARLIGAVELRLLTEGTNYPAQRLYRKLGLSFGPGSPMRLR